MNKKYYVTATDSFLSGWGKSKDKINKIVVECYSYEVARKVYDKLKDRADMKYVNICNTKPYYSKDRYYVSNTTPSKWIA